MKYCWQTFNFLSIGESYVRCFCFAFDFAVTSVVAHIHSMVFSLRCRFCRKPSVDFCTHSKCNRLAKEAADCKRTRLRWWWRRLLLLLFRLRCFSCCHCRRRHCCCWSWQLIIFLLSFTYAAIINPKMGKIIFVRVCASFHLPHQHQHWWMSDWWDRLGYATMYWRESRCEILR